MEEHAAHVRRSLARARSRGLFRREEPTTLVPVKIGSRALDVLRMLIERPGELVLKDELVAAVWSGIVVEDSNLTVQISILRRILDGAEAGGSCVQTVAGRGYRFVAPVAHGPNGADSVVNIPIASERTGHRRSSRPWHLWLAGLAAVAAMALVAFFGWNHRWFSEAGAPRLSIVVLPFANLNSARHTRAAPRLMRRDRSPLGQILAHHQVFPRQYGHAGAVREQLVIVLPRILVGAR